jgi:hypothetical protein
VYRHKVLRDYFVGTELPRFLEARTPRGFLEASSSKTLILVFFYLGATLVAPWLMLPRLFRDPQARSLLLIMACFLAGILLNAFLIPHYFAPATAALYALLMLALRRFYEWRPAGRLYVRLVPALALVLCVLHIGLITRRFHLPGLPRAQVEKALESKPGNHLAIVRYSPGHDPLDLEWVNNAAGIDGSRIVWAREMSPAENRELTDYFRGRQVWLIEPDQTPVQVKPYPK